MADAGAAPYTALAADYHWLYDDVELRLGTATPGVRGALTTLPEGARILDAACGIGLDLIALARRGFTLTGADANPAMLAEARRRLDEAGCPAQLVLSEWGALPGHVASGSFDAVLCTGNSIAHAGREPAMTDAFHSFAAVLRTGGRVVIDSHDWRFIEQEGACRVVDRVVARDGARCTRSYDWRRTEDGSGAWRLTLGFDIERDGRVDRRRYGVVLHPFTHDELAERLRRCGFRRIEIDADERRDRYTAVAERTG